MIRNMKTIACLIIAIILVSLAFYVLYPGHDEPDTGLELENSYVVVDTGQVKFYDGGSETSRPSVDEAFYGQDAHYIGDQPLYRDNGDGTVTDLNTGLVWQQDPGEKMTYDEAVAGASSFDIAGHDDWRLPTVKELYSLIYCSTASTRVAMRERAHPPWCHSSTLITSISNTGIRTRANGS